MLLTLCGQRSIRPRKRRARSGRHMRADGGPVGSLLLRGATADASRVARSSARRPSARAPWLMPRVGQALVSEQSELEDARAAAA